MEMEGLDLPTCLRIDESGVLRGFEQMTECIAKSMMVPFTFPKSPRVTYNFTTYIPTMGRLMEPWTRYPCLASGTGTTTNSGAAKPNEFIPSVAPNHGCFGISIEGNSQKTWHQKQLPSRVTFMLSPK